MTKRFIIMLGALVLIFGGIFGFKMFKAKMMKKYMSGPRPPATVTTMKAEYHQWQPAVKAVGSLRAVRGVDLASEIDGLVRSVHFKSGDEAAAGKVLVELNADADIAQLQALEAAADLAQTALDRDRKQLEIQAVSQAQVDADTADLRAKRAQASAQRALVEKKTIRAPFAGKLGISSVNPGQYVHAGDKIVTLQALDRVYADFYLPQQELSRIALGQKVLLKTDTYPDLTFNGRITAINPKVDPATRNIQVEATVVNTGRKLLPGMYGAIEVQTGAEKQYLTLPQTAVTYNPYGDTVFLVQEGAKGPQGKPVLTVKQTFVATGPTRGDQVAILSGVKEGETVVTSGQLKLKNGSTIVVNNSVQPSNEAAPKPEDE